ncbi:hypothetical protein CNR22_03375 [Sphingobacteriaceae bacterium]|nr:hypothetical protein CNR22_03375 [Sphingobacteriaceae bacterium]
MISALLVDDEEHNRISLRTLLEKHCDTVKIVSEANSAAEAYEKILHFKPRLIFLDIKMPKKSGLDLLKMFTVINFEVIFVTAYNRYAVQAFEFNALGYMLKPVDSDKLILAVKKATEKIKLNTQNDVVLHFVKTLSDQEDLVNKFSVHHNGHVIFISIADISIIETKNDITTLFLKDNSHYFSSKDLVKFEKALETSPNFVRINKNVIVNTHFIKSYTKDAICILHMIGRQSFEVSRRKKTDILKNLKHL